MAPAKIVTIIIAAVAVVTTLIVVYVLTNDGKQAPELSAQVATEAARVLAA